MKRSRFILILLVVGVASLFGGYHIGSTPDSVVGGTVIADATNEPEPEQQDIVPDVVERYIANISHVIDGDTVKLTSGETVRLIGINTPETRERYSSEAMEYLEQLLEEGEVTLEEDVTNRDQYDRLLRYVYAGDTFVNLDMVRQGLAHAYPYEPDTRYKEDFEVAEEEAKNAERGIWVQSEVVDIYIYEVNYDAEGNDNDNLNDEYVVFRNDGAGTIDMTGWTVKDEATHIYTFPSFSLTSGGSVTLATGQGTDTSTELYWGRKAGSSTAVWNNAGDTVYLRDAGGLLVDSESWEDFK